jgi:predicted CXXCH cytochrome family protein
LSLKAAQPAVHQSDQHQMPRNPSSAKECAICHYRWVDTFFLDGRGTDLVPLQTEPVVGTSEMCFSCHDGSVLDSRWSFEKDRGHRTGVPPRPGMVLPNNFPLDAKGNMQCVTCHSAHGVASAPGESASTFLRSSNTNSAMCMICHPTMAGNLAGENHPLGQVTNTVPRELWNKHTAPETAAHTITCQTCHTPHGNQQESLLKQNASDSTLCLTCHADKNSVNPDGTRNFLHVINVAPTNAIVPANLITNGAKLSKNGAITCLTCHKIHQNKIEKHLLVAKVDNQSTFCFNCHSDKKAFNQTKHNLTQAFPNAKNHAGKSVTDSGPCSACHMPHQNARPTAGADAIAGQCMGCHGLAGISSKTNLVGRSHPTDVLWPSAKSPATGAKPISLPLFDPLRRHAASGNITCLTCHDPHKAQPDGSPSPRPMFLRKNVPVLCQECHPGQIELLNTKHDLLASSTAVRGEPSKNSGLSDGSLTDPPQLLPSSRNISGQTPSESGSCGVCHLMHSANNSTWAQPLPKSPNPADKCRGCHQPGGSGEKKVVQAHSHPIDIALNQAGLKTTLPLYADLSQTNAPGKMTCVTCHDPHRRTPSATTASLSHPTEVGAKNGFLRMPVSPSPSLCADCHAKEALVVRTGHDLSHFLPDSINRLGQRAADSGPCGACHASHNAPAKSKLWARELVQPWLSTPVVDAMCRSCHSEQGVAGGKIPAFTHHPPVTIINQPASQGYDRSFFPLFDPGSGQVVNTGGISCSSCHNVHQWSTANPAAGTGIKIEGDSNNSFLRHRSAELPCKICHGRDALYRYQYFHKSSAHQSQSDALMDDLFR